MASNPLLPDDDALGDEAAHQLLIRQLASGTAEPVGSPARDRLELRARRHQLRQQGKDPAKAAAKAAKARQDHDDLAFVRQLFKAYSPVASPAVMAKAASGSDPMMASAFKVAEAQRQATRLELANKLSPVLQQSLLDALGTGAVHSCADCGGEGSVAGVSCPSCGGFGLDLPNLDTDADVEAELAAVKRVKKAAKKVAKKGGVSKADIAAVVASKGKAVLGVAVPDLARHPRFQHDFDRQLAKSYGVKRGQVVSKSLTRDELKKAGQ
jgi:rubrerythrin